MRLLSYQMNGEMRLGLLLRKKVVDLNRASQHLFGGCNTYPSDMVSLLEMGDTGLSAVKKMENAVLKDWTDLGKTQGILLSSKDIKILAPIPRPRKNIVCLGLNYIDHAQETNIPIPDHPVFFTKPPTTVIGPEDSILLPKTSRKVDYEVELAFVFGRRGKDISKNEAYDYVAGYTVFNDITARDLQRKHRQWYKGKGLDTFAPMGPYLVTKDEVQDPHNLSLSIKLNSQIMQSSNTQYMLFKIPTLVEKISADMTIEPGDIVATGTPAGVGFARNPPVFLQIGDRLQAEIENIGTLRNYVAFTSDKRRI